MSFNSVCNYHTRDYTNRTLTTRLSDFIKGEPRHPMFLSDGRQPEVSCFPV